MLEEVLETLVRRATEADGGRDLGEAREAFHARAGEFEPGEPWYEARIRFFLDWYLCRWVSRDGSSPAERSAAGEDEVALAQACRRAARGIYYVLDELDGGATIRVRDGLGNGRFRISCDTMRSGDRLRPGDVFDGHLVVFEDRIRLMPGPIFHPAETHEALAAVLERVRVEAPMPREEVLDGLLRMRMRLDRFTSMRARHIYRFEALAERDILSAGWARKGSAAE